MDPELESFFDGYRASFADGPKAIAAFYAEPCVTARAGVTRVNPSLEDTATLFAEVDKQYRARGFTRADYEVLDTKELRANSILATLRWSYKNDDDSTLWRTVFSYNLYRKPSMGGKILLQTMHDWAQKTASKLTQSPLF